MQPPLLLAFLLAASGGGGPKRDILSVSPHIHALENSAQRVVVECIFPDGDDSIPPPRQSEKSLLAIPPKGHPSIRLLEAEFEEYPGSDSDSSFVRWSHDQPGSATDVPASGGNLVRIKSLGICRDLNLAELEVFRRQDVRSEEGQRFRLYRRIRFEIPYPSPDVPQPTPADTQSSGDPFEGIFERILLNAPAPRAIRISQSAEPPIPIYQEIPGPTPERTRKVLAEGEGFFAVPLSELSKVGVRDPRGAGVALYDRGKLQQCFVLQNRRRSEQALVFYSRDASPFSRWNALWLVPSATETLPLLDPVGSFHGPLIHEATLTDRYEQDLDFNPDGEANENQDKDWLWQAVNIPDEARGSAPGSFDFRVPIPDLAWNASRIDIVLCCVTPKDKHNRRVRLSDYVFRVAGEEIPAASLGESLGRAGPDEHLIRVPIHLDHDRRRELEESRGIAVQVEAKQVGESAAKPPEHPLFVDYVEATYPHRLTLRDGEFRIPLEGDSGPWEIAVPEDWRGRVDPLMAAVLEDGRFRMMLVTETAADDSLIRVAAVPPDATGTGRELWLLAGEKIRRASPPGSPGGERLLSSERGADSIIITHRSLLPHVSPLVEWHQVQGARVEVVCTDEIYDTFGDGTLSPHAIRSFLQYVFHAWKRPPPSVVVLLGDATWDYKGRFGNGIRNFVPGYRVDGRYPTDHWFVTFEGDDKLPEMMIGRLPVLDATTCRTVVEKIVQGYDPPGPWRARSLMLSDKEPEFVREIDGLLQSPYVAPYYRYEWMRLSDFPFADNYYHPEFLMSAEQTKHSPECNQAIIDWLDRGVVLWDFHGHGAPNVLGHERIFFGGGSIYTDVKKLSNGRRYPLFLANTCDTARFDYAQEKWNISLGEDLLHHPDGGCIAMFLHTGRGYPGQHRVIDRLFLDSMFRLGLHQVGQIFTAGKILYLLNPKPPEPLDMMVLIGDPLTPFPLPQEKLSVTVSNSQLIQRAGETLELGFDALPDSPGLADIVEQNQYRAYAYVSAADHRLLWEEEDLPLESSSLRRTIDLPPGAAPGEAKVGVYFYPTGASPELALPDLVGCATFQIEVDPAIEEELRSRIRPDGQPNLRIASVVLEPTEPVNGHTIWINTTVVNDGSGEAASVDLIAFVGDGEGAPRVQSWAPRREQVWTIDHLYPSESKTARLRWDPFANAGRQVIRVVLDPKDHIHESNEADNSATAEVFVKRKADLVIVADLMRMVPGKDGLDLLFRFVNMGDCPVEQEFRVDVNFLADQESEPLHTESLPFLREHGNIPFHAGAFFPAGPLSVPSGANWIEIVIDPDDIADEETHQNNRALKRVERT